MKTPLLAQRSGSMNVILVKIFATALAMSQVTTKPDSVRVGFDPERDQAAVLQILRDGCGHMRKAFDIEDINLDDLIATAMEDPQAVAGDAKVLQGLNFGELHVAYRQVCKGESVPNSPVDLGAVIRFYNGAVADLPDHASLKSRALPGISTVLDNRGVRFAEAFEPDHRRVWVRLGEVPDHVARAFVAAEDKRFFQHKGVDERGVIRAFMGNLAASGRPQGGSTITQQVAKNLLVGDDVTYERKIREMIVASRLERAMTKGEILETYVNAIYLGRASWGIEVAARSYFGKPAKALTLAEGALLAGLAKGPNFYNPDRQPERARERMAYVLTRMQEDGAISADEVKTALAALPRMVPFQRPGGEGGRHAVDHLSREARTAAGLDSLTSGSYVVRSTLNAPLQQATEAALQEGLARYELSVGRTAPAEAEINLAETVKRLEAGPGSGPAWRRALETARLPLYDVRWPAAVVLERSRAKGGGETLKVGLADGRVLPLSSGNAGLRRNLKPYDVVRVRLSEGKGAGTGKAGSGARAELRVPPRAQGAALVLENATGRILAMAGGFSYPLSQLNRATQAHRQPGSAFKPLVYLSALGAGLQPNTLVLDTPVTLPPVGGGRIGESWTPKNYDGGAAGLVTLRRALENSKNLVTARLLDGAIARDPETSLQRVCDLALEGQLYVECVRHYPFVLGAQPVRLIDMAAFYATIANEGRRPSPYALESVEQAGRTLYRRDPKAPVRVSAADAAAFHQTKSILQGVLERGTARSIRALSPYVGGKTGTTDGENDAWFVGFTNEVTIAVWVGYDNEAGRRTLGRGQTGGKIAVPIFKEIVEAAWTHHAPRTPLAPPSPEAARMLVAQPIDLESGDRLRRAHPQAFVEQFRTDGSGQVAETQHRLVPRAEAYAYTRPETWYDGEEAGGFRGDGFRDDGEDGFFAEAPMRREAPWAQPRREAPERFGWREDGGRRGRERRIDPDYWWGGQVY